MTSRFGALFWRQIVRPSWRRPALTLLNVFSIALGVAVFLAIQAANRNAIQSFRSAAELTTGKADLEIRGDVPEEVFPKVQAVPGVHAATPIVEGLVVVPDLPGEYLRILGVDPFTGRDLFAFDLQGANREPLDFDKWLADPEAIAIQKDQLAVIAPAMREGKLPVLAGSARRELKPAFLFSASHNLAGADPRVAAMDIGWAQELLGKSGHLSSIQILLDSPKDEARVTAALKSLVPADVIVAPPVTRTREVESLLGSFQLNLTAMSLVSLFVGMLLIYNSVSASVVRRRPEIAILRACGATRAEVRLLFLGEAAYEALLGSALGIVLGPVLASLVATPIEQSVSSLYEVIRLGTISLAPAQVVLGFAVGIGASLVAAWRPASEAAACDPAKVLHPGAAVEQLAPRRPWHLAAAAIILLVAFLSGALSLKLGSRWLPFVSAGAVLTGFALVVPWLAAGVAATFRSRGVYLRLASDHLVRAMHRNAVTIASLASAVALTISVSVMIHSFRASVAKWITHTLQADLYISPAANDVGGFESYLPANALDWARSQPETAEVSAFREMTVRWQGHQIGLTVLDGKGRGDLEFLPGSWPDAKEQFLTGQAVAVSESLYTRYRINTGDTITLPTPSGDQRFTVCGVFRDFTNERGVIMMQSSLFQKYWHDARWHSMGIRVQENRDAVAQRFRATFGDEGQFVVYNNQSLRQRVFEIFDQTFAVTSVLRGIAVIVAIIGVLFSLSVLVMEREREVGVLRAIGASRPQVLGIFLGEAGLIGIAATICGVLSGMALAMVLTWVVNKAFFGWSIELTYPLSPILTTPLWLVPAALVAALFPAWRAANIRPAIAVRFE
ncbi:hypothetical protein DB345_09285 [Spartobacteria bacterium LR76]|nr:hypothetical protein DB345_09285 [Spartobacteria bacterium LR76]